MTLIRLSRLTLFGLLLMTLIIGGGCSVYFNTFFNAKKSFNAAEKARSKSDRVSAGAREYQAAIEKALKVVESHPNSKYYDDAVFMLAVSYFHTQQFGKAERRFRELLANYPETDFARRSQVYLAKTKLELGDIDDAMTMFAEIFDTGTDKNFKADAAMGLGRYHHQEKDYAQARRYFLAVRDSLGEAPAQLESQILVADGYLELFQFKDALGAFLQVLGMEPGKEQKYHALYSASICSFRLQRINDGMSYLGELINDEVYFDSLGILQLTTAEGYEYDDDLAQAEAAYEEVISTSEKNRWRATAYYRLGLIYQIDYDQLTEAKKYYDLAADTDRRISVAADAILRSSDIGKLAKFARSTLDSGATMAAIDEAAYTQYLLAELYWFKLNKPDSALVEMQYLIDSFATSYYAPKAMIARAEMNRELNENDVAADSALKAVLIQYPNSDFSPEALEQLGLLGTAADTGYAALHIDAAENFLIDGEQADSARVRYQYVVDNFPESKYFVSAKFALIWLTEMYDSPEDSSLILAYKEFADSFPGNPYATLAMRQLGNQIPVMADISSQERTDETVQAGLPELGFDTTQSGVTDTLTEYIDPMFALYRGAKGDTLVDIRLNPIETLVPFEFPVEAGMGRQYDWQLYFQILVDFSGKIIEFSLKIPSGIEEIDERAEETLASMTFDAMAVSNRVVDAGLSDKRDGEGFWFVFMYTVTKPEYLR